MATLSTEFDGSNDYVTLGTPAGMAGAPNDSSVDKCFSFWFKTTNSTYGRWLISQAEDSTGQYKWGVQNLFGQLRIWCGGGLIDTTGTAYEDGAWHHIAVSVRTVSSVRTVQVWVDGVSEGTNTAYNSASTTADWIVAAVRTTAGGSLQDFLDVKICELTFWSGAVNSAAMGPTEIAELYNGGTTTDPTTHSKAAYLVNYWKGGDGDTHPTWTDSVGSDDGTMVNMSSADFVADAPPSSGGSSYTGSVSETVTLSESLGSVRSAIVGLSETDALSEALAASRGVAATPAETVTLSESLAAQLAAVVAAGETVTLSEAVLNGSAYTAAPTETVTLSESVAGQLSAIPAPAETVALSEALGASKGNREFVNEFWTDSEAVTANTASSYTDGVAETMPLARALPEFAETDLHLVADDWTPGGNWSSRVGGFTAVLNGTLTKGIATDLERAEISGFGASDYFTLPANAAHETTLATQLTYEFVIRAHPSGGALMGRYGVPYSGSYDLATFSTAVGGVYNDAGTDYFGLAIGAHAIIARCYVVTFVLDSPNATWKVYVDGELDGLNTGGVGTLNNTTPADFFIGNSNGNPSPYAGAIVEIVRTRRVLTDPEINARRVHLLQVGTATTAAVSESVSLSESVGAAYSAQPTPSETVALTESAALAQVLAQGLTEGLGAGSESLAAQVAHTRSIAETVALSEALGATLGPLAIAETVSLAESVGVGQSFSQTLTETVPFSEQMAGVIPRILLIELATPAPVLAVETPAPVAVLDVTLTMVGLL